jgi:glycosyltransferase A (GT-A) superfamily protein (DUF2064 family)
MARILEVDVGENMKTCIVAFVKTPGLSELKTRLALSSSRALADLFYEKSLAAIDQWLALQNTSFKAEVFWAVAEDPCMVASNWRSHRIIPQGSGGLGERMARVYSQLNQGGQNLVILIGADAPQLSPQLVDQTRDAIAKQADLVIGPARDGGFYWFASRLSIWSSTWTAVQYSSPTTLRDLLATPQLKKLSVHFLPELTDVDEYGDLRDVAVELRRLGESKTLSQSKLLQWIDSLDAK